MELIGIGAIALAFTIILALVERERREHHERLREVTPPLQDLKQPTRAEETWHQHMPRWSDARYYNVRRRP